MRVTRRQFVELASLTLVSRAAAARARTDEAAADAVARRAAGVVRGYA